MLPRSHTRFSRTTLLTAGLLAALAGLGLVPAGAGIHWSIILLIGLLLLGTLRRRGYLTLVCVALFGLACGIWRGESFQVKLAPYNELYRQKVVLHMTALEDAVYGNNSQLTFDANAIHVEEPYKVELPGRIKVSGFGESMVYRGDVLEVEGKIFPARGSR